MTEHNILDSAIERKNHYQGRMAENMANILYFTKRKASLEATRNDMKIDTEERAAINKEIAQADKAVQSGHDNVEADQMLMASFTELIADLKKDFKGKDIKA